MKTQPLVSIVIPVFNGEQYLDTCLNTILAQTYTNYEVIIINDNSSDKTEEIIKNKRFKNILYIKNLVNLGTAESRNLGIIQSRGDLIAFLDADDKWYPSFLEIQVGILMSNPDIDAACSLFDIMDSDDQIIYRNTHHQNKNPLSIKEYKLSDIWDKLFISPSTVVAKRQSIFDAGLFSSGYTEDVNFWLKFSVHHKIVETQCILAAYRRHETQKTANGHKIMLGRTDAYLKAIQEYPEIKEIIGEPKFRNKIHNLSKSAADHYFIDKNEWDKARHYLLIAIKHEPTDYDSFLKIIWCFIPDLGKKMIKGVRNIINGQFGSSKK